MKAVVSSVVAVGLLAGTVYAGFYLGLPSAVKSKRKAVEKDIRKKLDTITIVGQYITTVAGTGTGGYNGDGIAATIAQLSLPHGVFVDSAGDLYIADRANHRIRKVEATTGTITTVAGTGTGGYNGDGIAATTAQLFNPSGVMVDGSGDLYISDAFNNRIRRVIP